MAAVLASGPGGVISHRHAAALWGLRRSAPERIEVTCGHKSRSTPLIRRHCSLLPPDEIGESEDFPGIPVTSVPRTILDNAASGDADLVESMLRQAERRRLYDRLSLPDLLDRYPHRRGSRLVRLALDRVAEAPGYTESPLEEVFLPFLRAHGLPVPRLNEWIALGEKRYRVDCRWPGTREIVELDGWETHGTRAAFRDDRERDRRLRVAGYGLTRIAWSQLEHEPAEVAADLRVLLGLPHHGSSSRRTSVITYASR
jgi:very-short-patch-repair endonuclease